MTQQLTGFDEVWADITRTKCDKYVAMGKEKPSNHAICEVLYWANKNIPTSANDSDRMWMMKEASETGSYINSNEATAIYDAYVKLTMQNVIPEYKPEHKIYISNAITSYLLKNKYKDKQANWVEPRVRWFMVELERSVNGRSSGRARTFPCVLNPNSIPSCTDKSNAETADFMKYLDESGRNKESGNFWDNWVNLATTGVLVVVAGVGLYFLVKLMK